MRTPSETEAVQLKLKAPCQSAAPFKPASLYGCPPQSVWANGSSLCLFLFCLLCWGTWMGGWAPNKRQIMVLLGVGGRWGGLGNGLVWVMAAKAKGGLEKYISSPRTEMGGEMSSPGWTAEILLPTLHMLYHSLTTTGVHCEWSEDGSDRRGWGGERKGNISWLHISPWKRCRSRNKKESELWLLVIIKTKPSLHSSLKIVSLLLPWCCVR